MPCRSRRRRVVEDFESLRPGLNPPVGAASLFRSRVGTSRAIRGGVSLPGSLACSDRPLRHRRDGSVRRSGAEERRRFEPILRGERLGFTLTGIMGVAAGSGSGTLALDQEQVACRDGCEVAVAEVRAAQGRLVPL